MKFTKEQVLRIIREELEAATGAGGGDPRKEGKVQKQEDEARREAEKQKEK